MQPSHMLLWQCSAVRCNNCCGVRVFWVSSTSIPLRPLAVCFPVNNGGRTRQCDLQPCSACPAFWSDGLFEFTREQWDDGFQGLGRPASLVQGQTCDAGVRIRPDVIVDIRVEIRAPGRQKARRETATRSTAASTSTSASSSPCNREKHAVSLSKAQQQSLEQPVRLCGSQIYLIRTSERGWLVWPGGWREGHSARVLVGSRR